MTIAGESGFLTENNASCLPCTPEEEKQVIKELMDTAADANGSSSMKEGDLYYVLSNRWFMEWQRYTRQEPFYFSMLDSNSSNGVLSSPTPRPSQIDNHHLVAEGSDCNQGDDFDLIRTLQEGDDYVLVSEPVWKNLHDWYKGGPALPRKVIAVGVADRTFSVEVFPLRLQLIDARDKKQYVIRISKKASLRELYHQVNMLLGEEKVCIWDYFDEKKGQKLAVSDQTLEEALLQMDQHILVEIEPSGSLAFGMDSTGNGLALVPVEPSRSSVTIAGGPSLSNGSSTGYIYNFYEGNSLVSPFTDVEDEYSLSKTSKMEKGGLAGLQNLGNTCFMNSALQCLVHTPPILEYFLQDYSDEINKQNPIGMQGELAIAFGDLLRKLWSSGRTPVAPRAFKAKLGRFAPQFSGYNQHDSHELLAFLLDGLHEDLNRVKFKPYIELKDANGRADEEVANECWEIHKARNDSVIVDVCQGQYKSTLVCPVCDKVSVTFDPFMYLSLPLPSRLTRSMTITVFYGDGSGLPMPFTVTVLKHGCFKDLFEALATACCLRPDEGLLLAEVYDHSIFKYLDNPLDPLSMIKDEDQIVAYRLPKNHDMGFARLEIIHRSSDNNGVKKCSGTPLVTCLAVGPQSSIEIQHAVEMVLNPLLKVKDKMEVEEEEEEEGGVCFEMWVTEDEKGMNSGRIQSDFVYEAEGGITMKVLLDWTMREYEMYDISYLEDLPVVHKSGFTAVKKTPRQEAISLFSCLEAFLKEEPLGPDDMWYCPSCKEHRQATKKLDLWRLPEVLVVHLKRFSYSRYLKNKLDTLVNFPIKNLDLSKYVKSTRSGKEGSQVYELYAISNHYGGLGGGHYSAYAKVSEEKRWYNFDDSHVSGSSEEEIKTAAAYVLFYRRVEHKSSASTSG